MGNKQRTKQGTKQAQKQGQMMNQSCQDDSMCKNIDSKRSTVDKLVYVCPNATCSGGDCDCGAGCEKDPYTGICCTKVVKEIVNGKTYYYCIEDPYKAPEPKCKVPDQTINGVLVPGKEICALYNKYSGT